MKPIELDAPTTSRVPDFGAGPIRVGRRAQAGGAGVLQRSAIAQPPALLIVTEETRPARIKVGAWLVLLVVMAALLWVLLDSNTTGAPSRPSRPPVQLSPAEQRLAAAARSRAAAIAQAKRDRGTDAELQDTIPALTPAPVRASAG